MPPKPPSVQRATPIFFVDAIEPALVFWEGQGWKTTVSVPHGDLLGFVILASGDAQIMLQTRASLAEDLPAVAALGPASALYVDVGSLAAAVARRGEARILVKERETFYGAREAWVVDPAGTVVGFAESKS